MFKEGDKLVCYKDYCNYKVGMIRTVKMHHSGTGLFIASAHATDDHDEGHWVADFLAPYFKLVVATKQRKLPSWW